FQVRTGDDYFAVMYNDFPADKIKGANPDNMLNGGRDRAVANVKGKLISEKKISLGKAKYPGRELMIQIPGSPLSVRQRMYLVENRLYQTIVVGTEGVVKSNLADKFHDSFKLVE